MMILFAASFDDAQRVCEQEWPPWFCENRDNSRKLKAESSNYYIYEIVSFGIEQRSAAGLGHEIKTLWSAIEPALFNPWIFSHDTSAIMQLPYEFDPILQVHYYLLVPVFLLLTGFLHLLMLPKHRSWAISFIMSPCSGCQEEGKAFHIPIWSY